MPTAGCSGIGSSRNSSSSTDTTCTIIGQQIMKMLDSLGNVGQVENEQYLEWLLLQIIWSSLQCLTLMPELD